MENALISVIVPVYNVEKYLDRCVNSLLNQTYENIEIILVDDGSTDNSSEICNKWCKQDDRIRTFHKINGGLSSARNYGIKKAKGKYITFVDSDDWIDENTFEIINEQKADMYIYGIYINDENGRKTMKTPTCNGKYNSLEVLIKLNTYSNIDVSVCNKIFLKSLFENIEFPDKKKCEDYYIIYKLIDKADNIYISNKCNYHYFQRNNSITRNETINYDYVYASREQLIYFEEKYPKYVFIAKANVVFANLTLYNISIKRNKILNKQEEIIENIKKNYKYVIFNKYMPLRKKFQIILFIISRKLYNKIFIKIK